MYVLQRFLNTFRKDSRSIAHVIHHRMTLTSLLQTSLNITNDVVSRMSTFFPFKERQPSFFIFRSLMRLISNKICLQITIQCTNFSCSSNFKDISIIILNYHCSTHESSITTLVDSKIVKFLRLKTLQEVTIRRY